MHKFTSVGALLLIAALTACGGGSSSSTTPPTVDQSNGAQAIQAANPGALSPAVANHWTPVFTTLPARNVNESTLDAQALTNVTLPHYQSSIVSTLDHKKYVYRILGKNPSISTTTTKIKYVPIVARVHYPDGTVLDPTAPGCGDTVSVQSRFFKGPNFVSVPLTSNGVSVGTTQLIDGFQRAEFWSKVSGTAWHTMLATTLAPLVVDVTAPAGSVTVGGVCAGTAHRVGEIDINAWDTLLRGIVTAHSTTSQLPVVLTYNTFQTQGGQCCVLGYHSAFAQGTGTQVYANGTYSDAGIFNAPVEDVHAWTHELGETFNNPFLTNATPAWGHVGQVSGCQNNLEVGDPLTGTAFTVSLNGFTYHPQELAFFDWFFRTTSEGTAGRYSFEGTFATTQGTCT